MLIRSVRFSRIAIMPRRRQFADLALIVKMCDDFQSYNNDTVHNMWVDYTASQYGRGSGYSANSYSVRAVRHNPLTKDAIERRIKKPATTVASSKFRTRCIREQLRRKKQSLSSLQELLPRITGPRKLVRYNTRIEETRAIIADLENLLSQEKQNELKLKARRVRIITLVVGAFCLALLALVLKLLL